MGAVATQNVTNPALGPLMLDRLQDGDSAVQAVAAAAGADRFPEYRQLLAIDSSGTIGIHSGVNVLGLWNAATGADCAAAGNLLANEGVPSAMVAAFESATGSLGDRLVAAMRAGVAEGGEAGPVRSAGLLVVDTLLWPYADLRIDWLDEGCPIEAMARAWQVYGPQADQYVARALNPAAAPSFGVPGDK